MATMNLLKADYNGTLGQTYGSKWKDKSVIKSRPFGKAPPTNVQTANVRAFECVNRLAPVMSKVWWKYFNLSDRKMLKHNAVAQALRPMLQHGEFSPGSFIQVVPVNPNIIMQTPVQTRPGDPVTIQFSISSQFSPPSGSQVHALVVDEAGHCGVPYTAPLSAGPISLTPPVPQTRPIHVLAFCSFPSGGKFLLYGGNSEGVNTMQYSLEEQLTGDTWLDGKPIYQKTFTGATTAVNTIAYLGQIPDYEQIISFKGVVKDVYSSFVPVPSPDIGTAQVRHFTACWIDSSDNVGVFSFIPEAVGSFWITIQYTKKT
jgi:hypothetical protein